MDHADSSFESHSLIHRFFLDASNYTREGTVPKQSADRVIHRPTYRSPNERSEAARTTPWIA